MLKIGRIHILTESEIDEINYNMDYYYKYKAMAEMQWEMLPDEEHMETNS